MKQRILQLSMPTRIFPNTVIIYFLSIFFSKTDPILLSLTSKIIKLYNGLHSTIHNENNHGTHL